MEITPSAQQLLTDFQSVFMSMSMAQTAEYEAERSEQALMQELIGQSSATYLQPGAINQSMQPGIAQGSLDAHIKKVQAQQLAALNQAQLEQLLQEDDRLYKRRKVVVSPLDLADQAIESVWLDPQSGYRNSTVRRRRISGTIEQVMLDRNILVVRPPRLTLLLSPQLQYYVVYMINPDSFQPFVSLLLP